jgi:hypothetical protein
MKNLIALLMIFFATAANAKDQPFCSGNNAEAAVYISIDFDNQSQNSYGGYTMYLTKTGQKTELSSGRLAVTGGGDGMNEAGLRPINSESATGTFTWWSLPSITPRISLSGIDQLIMLSCKGIWQR